MMWQLFNSIGCNVLLNFLILERQVHMFYFLWTKKACFFHSFFFKQSRNQYSLTCISSCAGLFVLFFNLTYLGRGNLNFENASIRSTFRQIGGVLSWLLIDVGGPTYYWCYHAWAGGLGVYKKTNWDSQ